MTAINYVARSDTGAVNRGEVSSGESVTPIWAGGGQEISLNLRQIDISGYNRNGQSLEVTLADGRIIVLDGYFGSDGEPASRLFISADGYLNEVELVQAADGSVYAQYGPTAEWGKWSPSDDLIFLDGTEVANMNGEGDDEVSMLGAGALLGGTGLLGAAGAGAAALGVAAVVGGVDDSGPPRIDPSVVTEGSIVIRLADPATDDSDVPFKGVDGAGPCGVVGGGGGDGRSVGGRRGGAGRTAGGGRGWRLRVMGKVRL